MPYTVKINNGYNNVAMPDGRSYDGGQTVTLSDDDYGRLDRDLFEGNLPILSDEGSAPIAGIPSEDWEDPARSATLSFGFRAVDDLGQPVDPGDTGFLLGLGPMAPPEGADLFQGVEAKIIPDITEVPDADDLPDPDDERWEAIETLQGALLFYEAGGTNPTEFPAREVGGLVCITTTYDGIPFRQYAWLDPAAALDPVDLGDSTLFDNDSNTWADPPVVDLNFQGKPRKVIPVLSVGSSGGIQTWAEGHGADGPQQFNGVHSLTLVRTDASTDPADYVSLSGSQNGSGDTGGRLPIGVPVVIQGGGNTFSLTAEAHGAATFTVIQVGPLNS